MIILTKICITVLILAFNNAYSDFVVRNCSIPGYNKRIASVKVIDANKTFAISEFGKIFKTTNGGTSWDTIASGVSNVFFASIDFYGSLNGMIVGDNGVALQTSDGGITWNNRHIPSSKNFASVKCKNELEAYAVGSLGAAYHTVDGGVNWTNCTQPNFASYFNGIAYNGSKVHLTSFDAQGYWCSTNNGVNWVGQTLPETSVGFDICFFGGVGYIAGRTIGNAGIICRTTNDGLNWIASYPTGALSMKGLGFVNNNIGYALDNTTVPQTESKLYITSDAGINWNVASSFPNKNLRTMSCYGSDSWLVGDSGSVYRVSNTVGISQINTISSNYSLSQNYPNPFNPSTTIRFTIPKISFTTLKIYDLSGKEVSILVNKLLTEGEYEYEFDDGKLTSGLYFYELLTNNYKEVKKMILLK